MSAYQDGDFIVPVKLEVKQFKDKQNTLYVAISLEKIKMTEVWKQGNTENGVTQNSRSVTISIARIFQKINPSDKNFLKYIPDGFLDDKQKAAKREAVGEDVSKNSDIRYSDRANYGEGLSEEDKETAKKVISGLKIYAQAAKYGIRSMGTYTDERIDREIRTSSSDTVIDYAKSYITWVDPIDFIYATTTSEQVRQALKDEAGDLDIERLRKQTQPIHLTVDFETGEITGHEGRHRMLALQKAGVEKVAVVIDAWNDDRHNTKPIEFMNLEGQNFGRYSKGTGFMLHNVLPSFGQDISLCKR